MNQSRIRIFLSWKNSHHTFFISRITVIIQFPNMKKTHRRIIMQVFIRMEWYEPGYVCFKASSQLLSLKYLV